MTTRESEEGLKAIDELLAAVIWDGRTDITIGPIRDAARKARAAITAAREQGRREGFAAAREFKDGGSLKYPTFADYQQTKCPTAGDGKEE